MAKHEGFELTGDITRAGSETISFTPTINTGTSAPSTTPKKTGDIFVDTTNGNIYISKGTTNSSDWVKVNN
jgi:hypothetical protein